MGAGDFQPLDNLQNIQKVFTKQGALSDSEIGIPSICPKLVQEPE